MRIDTDSSGRSLAERFCEIRTLTERLAEPLTAEDQTVQTMPDVSPTKWHRAHTSWFFETFVLEPALAGYRPYDEAFAFLFNSYYEAVGPRHARNERGLASRPGAAEIGAYRTAVDRAVLDLADKLSDDRGTDDHVAAILELGLHHEQQHQELLLMDAKHVLATNPLRPVYKSVASPGEPSAQSGVAPAWIEHTGGLVDIGLPNGVTSFGFDNEFPLHPHYLQPFALADRPVTNREWLAFIDDDGYRRPELWLSEGWGVVNANAWRAPLYWLGDSDDDRLEFTLAGVQPLDLDAPVCHVSYYEADAYAHWTGARLPTEPEWEAIAAHHPADVRALDLAALRPTPARGGFTWGDVWEWTASSYVAYPGFRTAPGAVGEYNGKFMVNQQVLRGGSCLTPSGHTRPTYRNFFPAPSRWVCSGVRLAKDLP